MVGNHLSMGTELVGDRLSRGTNQLGTNCGEPNVRGPYVFGTKCVTAWLHCKPIPVMKTGFPPCSISHREKPVFNTWEPCNEIKIFPCVEILDRENPVLALYWLGPVRNCSVPQFLASRFLVLNSVLSDQIKEKFVPLDCHSPPICTIQQKLLHLSNIFYQ